MKRNDDEIIANVTYTHANEICYNIYFITFPMSLHLIANAIRFLRGHVLEILRVDMYIVSH